MSKRHAYRLLDQAAVIAALNEPDSVSTIVDTLPEAHARELLPLKAEPAKVQAAYNAAQQLAEAEGRKATAADMRHAVAIVQRVYHGSLAVRAARA